LCEEAHESPTGKVGELSFRPTLKPRGGSCIPLPVGWRPFTVLVFRDTSVHRVGTKSVMNPTTRIEIRDRQGLKAAIGDVAAALAAIRGGSTFPAHQFSCINTGLRTFVILPA